MVHHKVLHKLFKYPHVHSVGEGLKQIGGRETGAYCVIAFVDQKLPLSMLAADERIPETLRTGFLKRILTDVVEMPRFELLQGSGPSPSAPEHRKQYRPVQAGISTSVYNRSGTGTITSLSWRHKPTGKRVGSSNNHVWAGLNQVPLGTGLQQPGVADKAAQIELQIGKLLRFVFMHIITSTGPPQVPPQDKWNRVDLALAENVLTDESWSHETLEVGRLEGTRLILPADIALPKEARACWISGRTSGLVNTYPTAVNVSSFVGMGSGRYAFFVGQIALPDKSVAAGDSGSPLIWKATRSLSGVIFAGSSTGSGLANSIGNVISEGELEYYTEAPPPPPPPPQEGELEYSVDEGPWQRAKTVQLRGVAQQPPPGEAKLRVRLDDRDVGEGRRVDAEAV